MGKTNLLKQSLTAVLLGASLIAAAQTDVHPLTFNSTPKSNYYKDFVGTRFTITAPASVAGQKLYTTANDGSGTGDWGGLVTGTFTGTLAINNADTKMCGGGTTSAFTGKVALIDRGDCEFGFKALAAQNNGATAVIIANNVDGGPVGMGAGAQGASVTIPVFMISKTDGEAIKARLAASETVTLSVQGWSSGKTNDLGILINGTALSHAYALPAYQLASDNGNPDAYKNHDGAFVANFGSANQTNVKLQAKMTFTTNENVTSTINDNDVTISGLTTADSIRAIFLPNGYDVHTSGKGRFDMTYTLSMANTDDFTGDNTNTYSFYATDRIYSKGRFDFATSGNFPLGKPYSSAYYQLSQSAGASAYTWGPMYYVAKGGYGAQSAMFSLASSATGSNDLSGQPNMFVYLFKWKDGDNSQAKDSLIELGELSLAGVAQYEFKSGDTSNGVFTANFVDMNTGNPAEAPLEANSMYWVAAEVDGSLFLGVDGILNYFPRSYVQHYKHSYPGEAFAPILAADKSVIDDPSNNNALMRPFAFDRLQVDSVVYANQATGLVPSIPLITGQFKTDVKKTASAPAFKIDVYPNPVVDQMTATVNLEKVADVTYNVIDGLGRNVARETHNGVINDKYTLDATKLAAGNYYISILADGKVITRKFVVSK